MAYTILTINGEAGNTTDTAIYTVPAGQSVIVGNLTAYNTTAGPLTVTIKIKENDGTKSVLCTAVALAATTAVSFSGGSTIRITPITLNPGNQIIANGSGAGITLRGSGLRFS
jgi:hypothetical protein